ncbi:hypothetical protein Q5P01_009413 [Channa striata]|uniref:Uncharacterized protein n=1 Tax=Channa striata TaxID=64152 RepID=A0AA88N6R1_CHASR|nr:hypothetical protein Q5P01_009413 [Channa striata]
MVPQSIQPPFESGSGLKHSNGSLEQAQGSEGSASRRADFSLAKAKQGMSDDLCGSVRQWREHSGVCHRNRGIPAV